MNRSKLESAGYEARRYRKRPNETSNSEVKETMKVSITAKRAVILFMTMALAVAMVACSGAVGKTGEPGDQGPPGPPGEPPEPVNLAPIARATAFEPMMLREDGDAGTRNVAANFVDPDEDPLKLTISVSAMPEGAVTAVLADGVLTVTPVAAGTADITVTATDGSKSVSATLKVTVEDAGVPIYIGMLAGATLTYGGQHVIPGTEIESSFEGEALTFSAVESDDTIVLVSPLADDNTLTITALGKVGKADVTITAMDEDGETISHSIEISVVASYQPEAVGTPDTVVLTVGDGAKTVDVSGYFSDPAGDELMYTAVSGSPDKATADTDGSMVTITPVAAGDATVTVTATNSRNLSATRTISVTVNPAPNNPPTLTPGRSVPDVTLVLVDDPSWARDVSGYFMDADGDALMYSADSSDDTKAMASVSGSMVTITALAEGSATITVTASDDEDSAAMSIYVTVAPARVTPTPNAAPSIKKAIGDRKVEMIASGDNANMEISINLSEHFEDPEMGPLYYNVSIVSQSPTATTTPAPKVIDLVAGFPDGTDLNSSLVIDAMSTGTAMVKVVARDAQLAATESTFMITVVDADSNEAPDNVAPGTAPIGAITDVVTVRLKVGETKTVIDDREIIEYFTDLDFPSVTLNQPGDKLTFMIKHYPATVPNGAALFDDDGDPVDPAPEALEDGKNQVSAVLSQPTWTGNLKSKFTLRVTGLRGSTAPGNDSVAIIATDEFGKSAARVFPVRVNHRPVAYGPTAAAAEKDRKMPAGIDKFLKMDASSTDAVTYDLDTLTGDDPAVFSDADGSDDTLMCSYRTSEANFASDDKTVTVTLPKDTNILSVTPIAGRLGSMSITVWCSDGFEDSPEATIPVKVIEGASIHN